VINIFYCVDEIRQPRRVDFDCDCDFDVRKAVCTVLLGDCWVFQSTDHCDPYDMVPAVFVRKV